MAVFELEQINKMFKELIEARRTDMSYKGGNAI